MGSFITRAVIMLLGYVYPAYECFKVVERNRPEVENLKFWCQYWIIIAVLTVFERVADVFVSWVPMYCEAKLFFIIYLWYPKTLGTTYVYSTFLQPFVARHEADIDRQLNELMTRAGDLAFLWWQRGSVYVQARFYEILAYVAAQSNRTQQQGPVARQPPVARQAPPPRTKTQQGGPPPGYPPPQSAGGAGYPAVNVDPYPPAPAAQGGPALYPPVAGQGPYPPPSHSAASVHRRRPSGTKAGSGSSDEEDYERVEPLETKQANPTVGEQEVPPRPYNTRNRLRSTGSRNWFEWLGSLSPLTPGKDD